MIYCFYSQGFVLCKLHHNKKNNTNYSSELYDNFNLALRYFFKMETINAKQDCQRK